MSDPNLLGILSELRDTNKDKRRTAVMKLGMLGGDEAVRALIRTLENDYEDLIVRGRAAMMLGKMGNKSAVAPLIRALEARFTEPAYEPGEAWFARLRRQEADYRGLWQRTPWVQRG